MKVFLAGTSLLPTYGGPAFSVSQLAIALAALGVDVALWASDQSAATTPLIPGNPPIRRLLGTETEALSQFQNAEIVHDNGIWLRHNHRLVALAAKRGLPRFISMRGMLEPWAMNHKRWKKSIAWPIYQRRDLQRAACLHATSESEARNLDHLQLGSPIYIIPNGVEVPPLAAPKSNAPDKTLEGDKWRTALFLGRIYPVKGLPMLVEAWARVRPTNWRLKIAGPDEAGHQAEVQRAITAAGLGGSVSFIGPLGGAAKSSALQEAELLVLPSHSESFGVVVAEALAHAVPVLTTTGTPWLQLRQRGCGWWVEATVDGIAEGLRRATSCDPLTLSAMGIKGREWATSEFGWVKIAAQFVNAYEGVLRTAGTVRHQKARKRIETAC